MGVTDVREGDLLPAGAGRKTRIVEIAFIAGLGELLKNDLAGFSAQVKRYQGYPQ